MQSYLDSLLKTTQEQESATHPLTDAQAEHQLEVWKTRFVAGSGMSVGMFKSVLEAGQTAIKSLMLLNGGSAVAMLAFVGNALANVNATLRPTLLASAGIALLFFAIGAGLSGFCSAFRYLSQECYSNASSRPDEPRWMKWGIRLQYAAILMAAGSLTLFLAGAITAYRAIVHI
jgi:hypothetical protein